MQVPQYMAGGDISPSRIVKVSASFQVTQSGANAKSIGISQEGQRKYPYTGNSADDILAAKSGESIRVYGLGECCLLSMGVTATAGDWLISDGNGRGDVFDAADATLQYYVCHLLEDCTATGQLCRVQVMPGACKPA